MTHILRMLVDERAIFLSDGEGVCPGEMSHCVGRALNQVDQSRANHRTSRLDDQEIEKNRHNNKKFKKLYNLDWEDGKPIRSQSRFLSALGSIAQSRSKNCVRILKEKNT